MLRSVWGLYFSLEEMSLVSHIEEFLLPTMQDGCCCYKVSETCYTFEYGCIWLIKAGLGL